jgi:hypothetical protein
VSDLGPSVRVRIGDLVQWIGEGPPSGVIESFCGRLREFFVDDEGVSNWCSRCRESLGAITLEGITIRTSTHGFGSIRIGNGAKARIVVAIEPAHISRIRRRDRCDP